MRRWNFLSVLREAASFVIPLWLSDPWLDSLRRRPEFAKLLQRAEEQHEAAKREFERLEGNRILGIAARAETA